MMSTEPSKGRNSQGAAIPAGPLRAMRLFPALLAVDGLLLTYNTAAPLSEGRCLRFEPGP